MDRQFRLARHWSNEELRKIAKLFDGHVLNASAGTDEDKEGAYYGEYFSCAATYELSNYSPGSYRGYEGRESEHLLDLTSPLPSHLDRRYDVVFNHTVLEHIFDVHLAFATLCRLTRDVLIVVAPFAQVQHENDGYEDFWRLTPGSLRRLFAENGMTPIYEAANDDSNAATYLFFVGARHPEAWTGRIPAYEPLRTVGSWIGRVEHSGSLVNRIATLPLVILRQLRQGRRSARRAPRSR